MGAQVDAGHQQQGVVSVELRELCVAPVKLTHTGTVNQRDGAIWTLCVPELWWAADGERERMFQNPDKKKKNPI